MAGKSKYTEEQKARAYVVLTTNEGNLKRTARDLGIPLGTLRGWRDGWERDGSPDISQVEDAVTGFLEEAEEVRDLALRQLKMKLEKGEGNVSQVATVLGILDDKIARAKGISTTHEHKVTLPSAEEIRDALGGFAAGALAAAAIREEEIVDAEVIEPKALPAA